MLIRPHDDATDQEDRWRQFIANQGFGHFVASGTGRDVPVVVPTQFELLENRIVFHLAANNPVLPCLAENERCVMSVAGDWAYIPGGWKAVGDEDARRGIPTTYYAGVQLTGRASVISDPDEIAEVLRIQLASQEPDGDLVDPIDHGAQLRAIRALAVEVDEVRAKFKYGGNVDVEHRQRVADQLVLRDGPGDRAALGHMPLGDPST